METAWAHWTHTTHWLPKWLRLSLPQDPKIVLCVSFTAEYFHLYKLYFIIEIISARIHTLRFMCSAGGWAPKIWYVSFGDRIHDEAIEMKWVTWMNDNDFKGINKWIKRLFHCVCFFSVTSLTRNSNSIYIFQLPNTYMKLHNNRKKNEPTSYLLTNFQCDFCWLFRSIAVSSSFPSVLLFFFRLSMLLWIPCLAKCEYGWGFPVEMWLRMFLTISIECECALFEEKNTQHNFKRNNQIGSFYSTEVRSLKNF